MVLSIQRVAQMASIIREELERIKRTIDQFRSLSVEVEPNFRELELGDIVAVVSPSGIGLSGSGRSAVYIPPLPKVVSDEVDTGISGITSIRLVESFFLSCALFPAR